MNHVAVAILGLAFLAEPAVAAVAIEVQAEAAVCGPVVRLGDIALIDGDASGHLRDEVLCPAPLIGQALALPQARIHRRLLALLGTADFTLAGAAACRITRVAPPATAEAPQPTVERPTGRTLETLLRQYVLDRTGRPADRVRIEFDPRDAADLALDDALHTFRFFSGSAEVTAGPGAVRVEAYDRAEPRRLARTLYVRFRAAFLEDVIVAARDLRPGDVLTEQDVCLQRREFHTDASACLRDAADAVGATVRAAVQQGQPVRPDDVVQTLLVRRGDVVTVNILGRGFSMKTVSRALESGEAGSVVAVQGKDGKGKFYAQVVALRTVELRLSGARALAAPTQVAAAPADTPSRSKGE